MNTLENITSSETAPYLYGTTNTNNYTEIEKIKHSYTLLTDSYLSFVPEFQTTYDVSNPLRTEIAKSLLQHDSLRVKDRSILIHKLFIHEFLNYGYYIKGEVSSAIEKILTINKIIANLNFEKIAIEISPLNSIKYKIPLKENRMVIIAKPLGEMNDLLESEVLFTYLINGDTVLSIKKDIYDLIEGVNKFIED